MSTVAVEIKAEHLSGTRPDGTTVTFRTNVDAEGSDASSLVGRGRQFGSGGVHSYYPATGSVAGNVVTLAGVVDECNEEVLVGSPVQIVGDASSGAITLTFGPLAGGHFAGHTIAAQGAGQVTIKTG